MVALSIAVLPHRPRSLLDQEDIPLLKIAASREGILPGKILDCGVGHLLVVKNCENGERDILGAKKPSR